MIWLTERYESTYIKAQFSLHLLLGYANSHNPRVQNLELLYTANKKLGRFDFGAKYLGYIIILRKGFVY